MLTLCHMPTKMKVGTIITVYKGGKKDERNTNSYRAINPPVYSTCLKRSSLKKY